MPFWVLFDNILKRGLLNSVNLQESSVDFDPFSLARAKAGRVSPEILYEDLCYDVQQAVEKAFKSVCIIHEIVFPKTHDIAYLFELLEKGGLEVPENLQNAKILTGYAVETRYPGDYEPVDEEDLRKAIEILGVENYH